MSDVIIYLKLDPYLAQWLTHKHGGVPVEFPKNSTENDIMELGLTPKPYLSAPNEPGENRVPIAVPYFKHKNVRYNDYLPHKARKALAQCIRERFVVELWQDLFRFGYIGKRKQDIIWAWMEAHGIAATETNWNTIAKIYLRKRNVYREIERRKSLNDVKKPTT